MNPKPQPPIGGGPLPPGVLIPGVTPVPLETQEEFAVRPTAMGTGLLCLALLITAFNLDHETATDIASTGAYGVGAALLVSLVCDFQLGWRNLVRADVAALMALYFLTLFEFLTPQQEFENMVTVASARASVEYCLWAVFGLAVGRHFTSSERGRYLPMFVTPISPLIMIGTYWFCFFIGYWHMLAAVNFNVVEMVDYFLEPRFFQPWGRGRFGDWKALLVELGMLLNLLPPLTGVMVARRERYSSWALLFISLGTLFTFFYGFSSGTRNIFCTYLVTFVIGYLFGVKNQ